MQNLITMENVHKFGQSLPTYIFESSLIDFVVLLMWQNMSAISMQHVLPAIFANQTSILMVHLEKKAEIAFKSMEILNF